jgi:hypothetical protein
VIFFVLYRLDLLIQCINIVTVLCYKSNNGLIKAEKTKTMNRIIQQTQKQIVLYYTGSGKPSFKKFHQAIKDKKNEMEIVCSIETLLNDPNEGGTEVWTRFVRNCRKHYGERLNKHKLHLLKQEKNNLKLAINKHHEAMGLVIAAYSKLQCFGLSSSKSVAKKCSEFFMNSKDEKKLLRLLDTIPDECANDLLESLYEILKSHKIKL